MADFERHAADGALVAAEAVLRDVPRPSAPCRAGRLAAQVPPGLAMGALFPGDQVHFEAVRCRGAGRNPESHHWETHRII